MVRRVRKSLGYSQEYFARVVKVSKGAVQHWESGRSRPSPPLLKRMIGLAPDFAGELAAALEAFDWHPRPVEASRYPEETVQQLHEALDLILDNAPSEMVKTVAEFLTIRAGKYGGPTDRPEAQAPRVRKRKVRTVSR